jgi:hypothetical protein
MKTRLIFLVLLLVGFSCGTNNKPVSDAQKEKIKAEVKGVVDTIFKGAEEANFEMAIETWLDSPDFVYTYNGSSFVYKQFVDAMKPVFGTIKDQKITIVDEKYAVLDNSTVLYICNSKCIVNYKDGHSILQDPYSTQFLFKKVNGSWKVINCAESGAEKNITNRESSKGLNQVELMKQLIGNWKVMTGKDTTFIMEIKSYGSGLESFMKTESKGKILMEAKSLYGYDKKNDILIESQIEHSSPESILWALWFTSANKAEEILLGEYLNPAEVTVKWEYELKPNDLLVATFKEKNNVVAVYTFTRGKK